MAFEIAEFDDFDVTYDIGVADFDNDGDLDVLTAENGAVNRLFDNDGTGLLSTWGTYSIWARVFQKKVRRLMPFA